MSRPRSPKCPHEILIDLGPGYKDPELDGPSDPHGPNGTWKFPRRWFKCAACGQKTRQNGPRPDVTPRPRQLSRLRLTRLRAAPLTPWRWDRRRAWTWKNNPAAGSGVGAKARWGLERRVMKAWDRLAVAMFSLMKSGQRVPDLAARLLQTAGTPGQDFGLLTQRRHRFYLPEADEPLARAYCRVMSRIVSIIHSLLYSLRNSLRRSTTGMVDTDLPTGSQRPGARSVGGILASLRPG